MLTRVSFVLFVVACRLAQAGDTRVGCAWPRPISFPHVDFGESLRSYIIDLPNERLDQLEEWPTSGALNDYRSWVENLLDPSPRNHELLIRRAGGLDRDLNRWMLRGQVGLIRSASCLERLLLALHDAHTRLVDRDAEFRAWILERRGALRIYFATHSLRGWGPNLPRATQALLDSDLQQGWRLAVDLHNHPFYFAQSCGPGAAGGFPAPSPDDLNEFIRSAGDPRTEFRVTNGFFTGVMNRAQAMEAQTREGQWLPARVCQ